MGKGRCGGDEDEDETDAYDPSDKGPNSKRGCTDVPCLLLLAAFIGAWIGVGFYSFSFGNPAQLIHPSNSEGEICGRGVHAKRPYLLFFDLTKCARLSSALSGCSTPQVCVSNCPTTFWSYKQGSMSGLEMYCANLAPGELANSRNVSALVKQRKCPAYLLPSSPILGRCIPDPRSPLGLKKSANIPEDEINEEQVKQGVKHVWESLNLKSYAEKLLADLALDWWILLLAILLACILSFTWIVLIRLAAGVIVYSSIVLCCLLLLSVTGYSIYRYILAVMEGDQTGMDDIFAAPGLNQIVDHYLDKDTWLGLSCALGVITLVILLVLLFLRKRIAIAVKLIEEASRAVGGAFSTLLFPILPFILQSLVILWFLMVASCLATAGEKEFKVVDACPEETCINPDSLTNSPFTHGDRCDPSTFLRCTSCPQAQCVFNKYGPSTLNSWLQLLNFVGVFWLLFFFSALGEMVMAGAFSDYYWTRDKSSVRSHSSLGASIGRAIRYHLGTLAFGSLVLTIVRMIRVFLEWIEEKLKKYGVEDNTGVKCIMCCCKCCMWCLEKFIKYMNRNAYIMTAIYGYSFCKAGRKSFSLLVKNAVRAGTLDRVTDFILFMGKIIVVGIVTICAYFSFENSSDIFTGELNYKFAPLLFIALGTYAITSCFFSVYSMAVDTIFLCFLEDLDRHKGGPYFMSEDLKQVLDLKEYRRRQPEEIPLQSDGTDGTLKPL